MSTEEQVKPTSSATSGNAKIAPETNRPNGHGKPNQVMADPKRETCNIDEGCRRGDSATT